MNVDLPILLDGKPVEKITAFLFDQGGNDDPTQLLANANKSFQGSIVLGMGFTFDDSNPDATPIAEMRRLIEKDPRNQERIFPYIGGEEVNSSPTHQHHRYVINFGEMSEDEARKYPDLMAIVEEKVKFDRSKLASKGSSTQKKRAAFWWQFGGSAKELYKAIAQCERVLVRSLTSKHFCFAFLQKGFVYDQTLIIFAIPNFSTFAVLSCRFHEVWARFFGASLEDRPRYNIADCFETFPLPKDFETNPTLETIGQNYYEFRAELMVRHSAGLTATYNRFHDPDEIDPDILHLRQLHAQMDRAVLDAYGWQDISTDCEFRLDYEDEDEGSKRKKPWRYRWPEAVHDEVLARLLKLNQERAEAEKLGDKTKRRKEPAKPAGIPSQKQLDLIPPDQEQLDLL